MLDDTMFRISIMLVPGLFAITCHEVAHGAVASYFGDPTARMLGRLTLNPLKHIDIVGTLMLVMIGIGWAKPVPVVAENLRNPRRNMIWVSFAGPGVNMLIAGLSGALFRGVMLLYPPAGFSGVVGMVLTPVLLMLVFSIYINLLLALFNLLPIPPLDGGRIAIGILPKKLAAVLESLEPYGMIIILMLFLTKTIHPVLFPIHTKLFTWLTGGNQIQLLKPFMF